MERTTEHNWFWAHRRNAALHHFSMLIPGLAGDCWKPIVDFSIQDALIVNEPGKGVYVFYDQNELSQQGVYPKIEKSILVNPNFVSQYRRRTDEIFGALHFHTKLIREANVPLASDRELEELWKNYRNALMVGPIITVQLWGIEALFDPAGRLMNWLRTNLTERNKEDLLQKYRELLAINSGETIAYTEQKQLLRVLKSISSPELIEAAHTLSANEFANIMRRDHSEILKLIVVHADTYGWMHIEYQSKPWNIEDWIGLVQKELCKKETFADRLDTLEDEFVRQQKLREEAVFELDPPDEERQLIEGLAEFVAQRDRSKGYFAQTLPVYHSLLAEIGSRNDVPFDHLLVYTEQEVQSLFESNLKLSSDELDRRLNTRSVLRSHEGSCELITSTDEVIASMYSEQITQPFEEAHEARVITGLGASRGTITGYARVLERADDIHLLQEGEILVTYMTTVEFTPAFRTAVAIVTDEGGMACHAAITSREYGIPSVVGTSIATRAIQTGDRIEVNGVSGKVTILDS